MDEAIAMSMLILQQLKENQLKKSEESTERIVQQLMDDVLLKVEKDSFSNLQSCNVETEKTCPLRSSSLFSNNSVDENSNFQTDDFLEETTESHNNNNHPEKSEFESIRVFEYNKIEYNKNEDHLSTVKVESLLDQEFTDYEELNSMFLDPEVIAMEDEEMPLVSALPGHTGKHSLPETPSPDPMECESNISMNSEASEPQIKSESDVIDNRDKLNPDVRKSSRRTKGVNHHDFFPSDLLNFKYINSRIQRNVPQQKSVSLAKKPEDTTLTKDVEEKVTTSALWCQPSTSRQSPKESTILEHVSEYSTVNEFNKTNQDFNNELYNKKIRGKKRKLVRKERNFICDHYIYRPDFDDCSEEELRKLYQYLKLRTKGFVRPQPQEIIIDNFPIQYFPSEVSMKDCALFDAFDRVCVILTQRYPAVSKPKIVPKPYTSPNIIKLVPRVDPEPVVTICAESDDTDMSDSSFEDFEDGTSKKQKLQRPNFKIRGRNDIRNVTFEQALKEFNKPTSNGKYDGPVPVCVLKQARDDETFDGPSISKKVISLLEKIEAQPSKPKVKRQIVRPLDLKSNLAVYQRNKAQIITSGSSTFIPINRSISGSTNLIQVPQLYKKPSCKVTIRSSNMVGRSSYGIVDGKIRQQIIIPSTMKKVSPNFSGNIVRPIMRNSPPTPGSPSGKYPILKSAISGEYRMRPQMVGSETYKSVFSRPLSPSRIGANPLSANVQRHSLLTASSFNPPPAVAARRRLQIIGSGSKAQVIDKTATTVAGSSNSLLGGPKLTKILTSIPNNSSPSYLKEIPRETYSKSPQISLLQAPKIIQHRIHPPSSTPTTFITTASTPEHNKPTTDSKAAMANLTKPLILYSEPPSSNKIFSSSLTTVAGSKSISPMKTYVRLTPSSISSSVSSPSGTQILVKKSLLNSSLSVSSPTSIPVRSLPSGTSISIVKPVPIVSTAQTIDSVASIGTYSVPSNNQNSLLKHFSTPISCSNAIPSTEKSSAKSCLPLNTHRVAVNSQHQTSPTSTVSQSASGSGPIENRNWLTPISGTKFTINPNQTTTSTVLTSSNLLTAKKFPSDSSLSLLNPKAPAMIPNNANFGQQKNNVHRVLIKSAPTAPNNITNSPMISKLPQDKCIFKPKTLIGDGQSTLSSSHLFNRLVPKPSLQFGGAVPTSSNIPSNKAFTLLAPSPSEVRKQPNIFFVNSTSKPNN